MGESLLRENIFTFHINGFITPPPPSQMICKTPTLNHWPKFTCVYCISMHKYLQAKGVSIHTNQMEGSYNQGIVRGEGLGVITFRQQTIQLHILKEGCQGVFPKIREWRVLTIIIINIWFGKMVYEWKHLCIYLFESNYHSLLLNPSCTTNIHNKTNASSHSGFAILNNVHNLGW